MNIFQTQKEKLKKYTLELIPILMPKETPHQSRSLF